ncbi:embryonic protein UVS.2-like [Mantella aurantiaca]
MEGGLRIGLTWLCLASLTSSLPFPGGGERADKNIEYFYPADKTPPPAAPEEDESEDVFSRILRINKASAVKLYHGDIALDSAYSATACTDCLWSKSADGKAWVPYTLSSEYSNAEKSLISEALETFNTLTCVRFVERSTEHDYLNIFSGSGCWSYVGKTGGPQSISLMKGGCMVKGVVQHEVQHALGFYHEQSRSDRENFVDVLWRNINQGNWGEFSLVDTNNMELPYDYSSIMHYGRYSYTNTSGEPTLIPKPDQTVEIGQRYGTSSLDISKVKKLYDCNECSFLLTGTNGSLDFDASMSRYIDATNCLWLVRVNRNKAYLQFDTFSGPRSGECTSGYITVYDGPSKDSPLLVEGACADQEIPLLVASGSALLVELVHGISFSSTDLKASYSLVDCGRTFTADNGTVTSPGFPDLYPNLSDCITTIWAPVGFQIVLNFTTFDLEFSTACLYDYLTIIDGGQLDSPPIGRYCSNDPVPTITSTGNILLLEFRSDNWFNMAGYSADYHFGEKPFLFLKVKIENENRKLKPTQASVREQVLATFGQISNQGPCQLVYKQKPTDLRLHQMNVQTVVELAKSVQFTPRIPKTPYTCLYSPTRPRISYSKDSEDTLHLLIFLKDTKDTLHLLSFSKDTEDTLHLLSFSKDTEDTLHLLIFLKDTKDTLHLLRFSKDAKGTLHLLRFTIDSKDTKNTLHLLIFSNNTKDIILQGYQGHPTSSDILEGYQGHPTSSEFLQGYRGHPTSSDILEGYQGHTTSAEILQEIQGHPISVEILQGYKDTLYLLRSPRIQGDPISAEISKDTRTPYIC